MFTNDVFHSRHNCSNIHVYLIQMVRKIIPMFVLFSDQLTSFIACLQDNKRHLIEYKEWDCRSSSRNGGTRLVVPDRTRSNNLGAHVTHLS